MPMGEYSSWEDCISKNSDKSDPEAYCATIKRSIEGEKLMMLSQEQIKKNKLYAKTNNKKLDEDGYIIVEENKPIVFIGQITNIQEVKEKDGEKT